MDVERAINTVEEFLALLRVNRAAFSLKDEIYASNRQWRESQDQILARRGLVVSMAEEVDAELAERLRDRSGLPWEWANAEDATFELLGHLRYREEMETVPHDVGTAAPSVIGEGTNNLHAELWHSAYGLWEQQRYADATEAGVLYVLGTLLPRKLEVLDQSGAGLLRSALSLDPPQPGHPRLRLPHVAPDTSAWVEAHEGLLHFGLGCVQLAAHRAGHTDPRSALQFLAAVSVLAQWIDGAEVVHWQRTRHG